MEIDLDLQQYRNLYTISNNIEAYEGPVSRTKKIPHCAVKFETGKENRIDTEFLKEQLRLGASLSHKEK